MDEAGGPLAFVDLALMLEEADVDPVRSESACSVVTAASLSSMASLSMPEVEPVWVAELGLAGSREIVRAVKMRGSREIECVGTVEAVWTGP